MRESLLLLLITLSVSSAIMCYVCHTDYNEDCWENYEGTAVNCGQKNIKGVKTDALGCRTLRINHHEERTLIRECAYSGDNVEGKITRMSNKLIRTYNQCNTTKCNSSSSLFSLFSLGSILLLAMIRM